MRRFAFLALSLASATVAPIVPACSSSNPVSSSEDAGDAAIPPNQLQGQPCDPTLTSPCLAPPNSCFRIVCQEAADGTGICVESALSDACASEMQPSGGSDAGADTSSTTPSATPCESNNDCPISILADGSILVNYICGFPAFEGCNVSGVCMVADPARKIDGAIETACGCDGTAVPYVGDMWTSEPVESPSPCPPADAGADGGADAGAASDAHAPGEASVDGATALDATAPDDAAAENADDGASGG